MTPLPARHCLVLAELRPSVNRRFMSTSLPGNRNGSHADQTLEFRHSAKQRIPPVVVHG
jgi:hypothetical protein